MGRDLIVLDNIHFSYPPNIEVFRGFNFSLKQGERIGIMGANGSGKTTLFYLIMGLIKPQGGRVLIWGKPRKDEEDFREVRRRVGFLFQDPDDQLFMPTVEEDIAFGPLNLGKRPKETQRIVEEICEKLGISDLRKRVTLKLSWGQKRLVSLATILAMRPQVILLDEPTASIDDKIKQRVADYLNSRERELIIASHDREFLNQLCTKIYYLKSSTLTPVESYANI
jgi:cobalt/nickel transport system ATP-binding protein